jgi:hypothetical protein
VAGTVRDHRFADEAVTLIDGDVAHPSCPGHDAILAIAKAGDRDIDLRPDTSLAIRSNRSLGELDGPACIHVLLCRLGWFVGPDFLGCLACLDRLLLLLGVALHGSRHQCRIDDLSAHREIAVAPQPIVEGIEQNRDRLGLSQPLPEALAADDAGHHPKAEPDRVGVRRRRDKIEAEQPQPAQSVTDQIFHPRIGYIILCRQDQDFEHRHRIIGRASALRTIRISQRILEDRTETLKIDNPTQPNRPFPTARIGPTCMIRKYQKAVREGGNDGFL